MFRLVTGYKIGLAMHPSGENDERFADEKSARGSIARHAEKANIPAEYYRVFPCYLLEFQPERGDPIVFDLGNPVKFQRAQTSTMPDPERSESVPASSNT